MPKTKQGSSTSPYPEHTSRQIEPTSLVKRTALASISDGVAVNDTESLVTVLNRAAARMLQADPKAALRQPARTLFKPFSVRGRSTIVDVMNHLCADTSDDRAGETARQSKQAHTVLVIEDDEDISHLIALQLRCEGFEVLTTAYGKEAVSLVNSRHIDLITLDMMLPDISGTEVLHQIKANPETAAIPVIIVSVLLPEQTGDAEQGAADYIIKPFAFETLMKSIRRTLAASQ